MSVRRNLLLFLLLGWCATPAPVTGQSVEGGFYDLNVYRDSRSFSTLTIDVLAVLSSRVEYFAFTNYVNSGSAIPAAESETFYAEQHLRWAPSADLPVDLTGLWNLRGGADNDVARLGLRWRPGDTPGLTGVFDRLRLNYGVTFHLVRAGGVDQPGWEPQIEHGYSWVLVPDRLYLSGFMDHDLRLGGAAGPDRDMVVTEHQLGVAVHGGLRAVIEYLRNGYRAAGSRSGWGLGLQYIVSLSDSR